MDEQKCTLPEGVADVVLENIVDWVLVVDHETSDWVYCNPAVERIIGYRPSELVGHNTFKGDIYPEESLTVVRRILERLEKEKFVTGIDYELRHKDGRTVPVNVAVGMVPGSDGRIRYRVAIIRDMSIVQKLLTSLRKDTKTA